MSDSAKRIEAQECRGVPPMWCAHAERLRAPARHSVIMTMAADGVAKREGGPRRFETLLQFKGFAGGVPQNTERTTVKPWVGIAR